MAGVTRSSGGHPRGRRGGRFGDHRRGDLLVTWGGAVLGAVHSADPTAGSSGAAAGSACRLAGRDVEPAASASVHAGADGQGPAAIAGLVRVDQLGYLPDESKVAYLLASAPAGGAAFTVIDAAGARGPPGSAGPDRGPLNDAWPAVHPLDLSPLDGPRDLPGRIVGRGRGDIADVHVGTAPTVRAAGRRRGRVLPGAARRPGRDPGRPRRKPSH